jgi:prophage regulatory protein
MAISTDQLPKTGFIRLAQIVGQKSDPSKYKRKRAEIPALIPISRTTFLNGVKSGKYPKPVKLGERTTAWRVEDIRNLINSLGAV